MVTPVAATAAVQWYVAESDIAMFPTIGDIWLNRVTRAAIDNAARGGRRHGAKRARCAPSQPTAPLIGVSSFGNLQPAVDRITAQLEGRGFEVIHFHASGPGGRALEALAGRGELAGVIDLTTSELTDFLTGGVYSAGEARLTGAGSGRRPAGRRAWLPRFHQLVGRRGARALPQPGVLPVQRRNPADAHQRGGVRCARQADGRTARCSQRAGDVSCCRRRAGARSPAAARTICRGKVTGPGRGRMWTAYSSRRCAQISTAPSRSCRTISTTRPSPTRASMISAGC